PDTLDETDLPLSVWSSDNAQRWTKFGELKSVHFGTRSERAAAGWPVVRRARERFMRYCVFGDFIQGARLSGQGELGGNDILFGFNHPDLIATIARTNIAAKQYHAHFTMHELGHTLGLAHGGDECRNFKPQYHSIMNYNRLPGWPS